MKGKLARKIGGNLALAQFELETPTTIMIAERIAKGVYATDGTLGDVPVLEIAAAAPAGPHNHRTQVTAAHRDGH